MSEAMDRRRSLARLDDWLDEVDRLGAMDRETWDEQFREIEPFGCCATHPPVGPPNEVEHE